jgi:uncharacterized damage-inducible protein DinB
MNREDVAFLFRYNTWAWERILAQAARVIEEQYAAPAPTPQGSLRGTLVHALSAETTWLRRWQGESPTAPLTEADLPTFASLRRRWEEHTPALLGFVTSVTDEALLATLEYKTMKSVPQADTLWHVVAHAINHGTQHRSEAAMVLTGYGYSPGDLDLIVWLRQAR